MAATPLSDPNSATIRVPKLKYRQSSYNAASPDNASLLSSNPSVPTLSTADGQYESLPSPLYPPSFSSRDSSSRRTSVAPSSPATPRTPDKKAKGFFSSLFATKEPSALALAAYERQLKTQGTLKNGRITAVGMPGVSSAKLPPTVPKVNSKWDGTPLTAKEIEKKEKLATQARPKLFARGSTSEHSFSSSNSSLRTSTKRPSSKGTLSAASVYSTHSDGNRNQLADLYGWEIQDYGGSDGASSRPSTKGISVRSMPTYHEPSEPPKIPKAYMDPPPRPDSLSPNPPAHSHSPSLTPSSESPATPIEVSPILTVSSPDSEKTLRDSPAMHGNIRTTTIEAPPALNEVIINSSGVNILPPPVTAKRKPKSVASPDSLALTPLADPHSRTPSTSLKQEPKSILKKDSISSFTNSSVQRSVAEPPKTAMHEWTQQAAQLKAKMSLTLPTRSKSLEDLLGKGRSQDQSSVPSPMDANVKGESKNNIGGMQAGNRMGEEDTGVGKTDAPIDIDASSEHNARPVLKAKAKRIDSPTPESGSLLQRRKSRAAIFQRDQERWRERQLRT